MAKRRYLNIEKQDSLPKKQRKKKGVKKKESSPIVIKNISSKQPSYENYTFFKLDIKLRLICFLLLKHHNLILISSQDEIMLLLPKELESASKMQIPEEDIHQVLELSDGSIVVASDKKLYLFSIKKDNTLILNCSMKMLGRPRSFGLNELPNDIIIDYRENHLISYNKNNLEIQKSIEVLITSSLFISSLNYGMLINRNKTSFYDLPELNFLLKIKGNDQQGDL